MLPTVEYHSHTISAEGLHPTLEKIRTSQRHQLQRHIPAKVFLGPHQLLQFVSAKVVTCYCPLVPFVAENAEVDMGNGSSQGFPAG